MKPLFSVFVFTLLFVSNAFGQKVLVRTYFKDGRPESKGRIYKYSQFYDDKRLRKIDDDFTMISKKTGQWKYWYGNGQLRRIEDYKLVINKSDSDLPDGKWIYFNEQGTRYREEIFSDGILTNTVKEIYSDSKPAGKITIHDGTSDTLLLVPFTKGNNLVLNPDFDFFYYKPVLITYHGDTPVDDWMPFWTTPGPYTPDFVSNLRYIDVFSYSFMFSMPLPEKFEYAGLALYKESDRYSEYIQGKLVTPLEKGKTYCLRTSINLCSFSKYTVNRLAFYLSPSPVKVDTANENNFSPQVIFTGLPVQNDSFTTLCNFFTADGGERYLTAGRFIVPENMGIKKQDKIPQGLFGLERAAYYLIDDIQLFEVKDTLECRCRINTIPSAGLKDKPGKSFEADLIRLNESVPVVLDNVNFEFDSSVLLKSSDEVLNTLLEYLKRNPDVRIIIEGHTDDTGTQEYNQELSVMRAKAVCTWLINNGISSDRLDFKGFGKTKPLFNETDEEHRAMNRRVEVRRADV